MGRTAVVMLAAATAALGACQAGTWSRAAAARAA